MTQPPAKRVQRRSSRAPRVSVVIPSYNSARYVRQCLRSLRAQNTELPFEVILVDSSDDGADRIVAEEFPEVTLLHFEGRRSVGVGRNIGIDRARGEIILFLDTDCVAPPTWIDQMCTAIWDLGADGVGGSIDNGTPWNIGGSVGYYLEFFRFLAYDGRPRTTPFLVGGNCGFRSEVFRTLRYGDMSVGDDFTFNWRLMNQGRELLYVPSIPIRHLNKTGLGHVLSYQYKLGLGACAYRHETSPRIMGVLQKLPFLVAFMPFAVMVWIGGTVVRRRGFMEFLKFSMLIPPALFANYVWSAGFFRGLISGKLGLTSDAAGVSGEPSNEIPPPRPGSIK